MINGMTFIMHFQVEDMFEKDEIFKNIEKN